MKRKIQPTNLYNQTISWRTSYNGRQIDLKISVMKITPEYARELLRTMETNRNKRSASIKKCYSSGKMVSYRGHYKDK